ncbi:MAG: DUF11 domain-containing protein [Acidobacteria bacterium]|nr:MAG: DUF11 domain-containing protein [Acidobacteriota bacterium]
MKHDFVKWLLVLAFGILSLGLAQAGLNEWTRVPITGVDPAYVKAITVDSRDDSVIYVAINREDSYRTPGEGVFKTTDWGTTWRKADAGLENNDGRVFVSQIAVDPQNGQNLYCIVIPAADATGKKGIYRSTNGGLNWSEGNAGLMSLDVRAIVIDPTDPTIVYVATDQGIQRSTDSGLNWSAGGSGLPGGPWFSLAIDPKRPQILYCGGENGQLYKTTDSGAAWFPSGSGVPSNRVSSIVINPVSSDTLYVGLGELSGSGMGWAICGSPGVYKSTNGGQTWQEASQGYEYASNFPNGTPLCGALLVIDPLNPSNLYAANGRYVYRSTDAGGTWTSFASAGRCYDEELPLWALAVSPSNPSQVYLGRTYIESCAYWSDHSGLFAITVPPALPGGVPDLAVTTAHTSYHFTVGQPAEYLITVSNVGSGATTKPLALVDVPPDGLTYGSFQGSADGWHCSLADSEIRCTYDRPIAPGSSTTLKLQFAVSGSAVGPATNTARLTSEEDFNRANNVAIDATQVGTTETLFLLGNRFKVEMWWQTPEGSGSAKAEGVSSDSGYFWFFSRENPELLIKILDFRAVANGGGFWLFFASLTDVQTEMKVTDLQTGVIRTYSTPQGVQKSFYDRQAFTDYASAGASVGIALPDPEARVFDYFPQHWPLFSWSISQTLAPDPSLVGHWTFDSPDNLGLDSSGYGNHGVVNSQLVSYEKYGQVGGAARFAESATASPGFRIPIKPSLVLQSAVTVAAWVRLWAGNVPGLHQDNGNCIFSQSSAGKETYGFYSSLVGVGGPSAYFNGSNAVFQSSFPGDAWWYHLVYTVNGTTARFYLNGMLVAERSVSVTLQDSESDLYIGASPFSEREDVAGLVDDVRLYNRALSETEIKSLFDSQNRPDLALHISRFLVEVDWTTPNGTTGRGAPVTLPQGVPAANAGYLWFFDPANMELVLKIHDGREVNGHYWFFWGSLTDLQYTLKVTDIMSGQVKQYQGERGVQASGHDVELYP